MTWVRPRLPFLLLAVASAACDPAPAPRVSHRPPSPPAPTTAPEVDADHDGAPATLDCDDDDPTVHPGAEEVACNGVDDDCDGRAVPGTCVVDLRAADESVRRDGADWWSVLPDLDGDGWDELRQLRFPAYPGTLDARLRSGRDPAGPPFAHVVVPFDAYASFREGAVGEADGRPGNDLWLGRYLFSAPTGPLDLSDAVAEYVEGDEYGWTALGAADVDGDAVDDAVFLRWGAGTTSERRALLGPFAGQVSLSTASTVPVEPLPDPDGDGFAGEGLLHATTIDLAPWCPEGGIPLGDYTGDGLEDAGCYQSGNLLVFAAPFPDLRARDPIAVWVAPGGGLSAVGDQDGDRREDYLLVTVGAVTLVAGGTLGRFETAEAARWTCLEDDTYVYGLSGHLDGGGLDVVAWTYAASTVSVFRNVGF